MEAVHTTIAELKQIKTHDLMYSRLVEITGRVISSTSREFAIDDGSSVSWVFPDPGLNWHTGDTVKVICTASIVHKPFNTRDLTLSAHHIQTIRKGTPDAPIDATLAEIDDGSMDFRLIRIAGTITGFMTDEIDPCWLFLSLDSSGKTVFLSVRIDRTTGFENPSLLVDRDVEAVGICRLVDNGSRQLVRWRVVYVETRECIRFTDDDASHPFAPERKLVLSPDGNFKKGESPHRRWVSGSVIATWGRDSFYIHTDSDDRVRIHLMAGGNLPKLGERVTASGFVKKNSFYIRLVNAIYRKEPGIAAIAETPPVINPRSILYDSSGQLRIDPYQDGRLIRVRGVVKDIAAAETTNRKIVLDCDGLSIPVMIGESKPPEPQSLVDVCGVCMVNSDSDDRVAGFLRLTGVSIILRCPNDMLLIKSPPWWTPTRLVAIVICLLGLLIAAIIWNRMLHTFAKRQSAALMNEQMDHISAELKTEERTRLAVELHDTLAQTLAGISLEIDTATEFARNTSKQLVQHLSLASRLLESCRRELRNCLWDLRSHALEAADMNDAIELSLRQVTRNVDTVIRFNVPRSLLLDSTAHALMRIIRELVINAIRHGGATSIKIAGCLEEQKLMFSVTDNGCGFDPTISPGPAEGHYGLQGIRERVAAAKGEMQIESRVGSGTKIVIILTIQKPENGDEAHG